MLDRISPLEGRRLLDVGCGSGVYTLRMAERFDEVHAIDIVDEHLELLRSRVPAHLASRIQIEHLDARHLPFEDGSFDVVSAVEVLEHIDGVGRALAEIHRVLTENGRFFISLPNRLFPLETHSVTIAGRVIAGWRLPFLPWVPPLHDRWSTVDTFSPRTVRALLAGAGFGMSRVEYVMPPFDRWEAGRRWIKPLTGVLERTPARRFGVSLLVVARKACAGSQRKT
jgi:SAM-dependent methyltransferase